MYGRSVHLGHFDTQIEAVCVERDTRRSYHEELAREGMDNYHRRERA